MAHCARDEMIVCDGPKGQSARGEGPDPSTSLEPACQRLGLQVAVRVQGDVKLPLDAAFRVPVGLAVADQAQPERFHGPLF